MNELGVGGAGKEEMTPMSGAGREEMTPVSGKTGKETILFKEEQRRDARRHRVGSKPACNPELINPNCILLCCIDYQ